MAYKKIIGERLRVKREKGKITREAVIDITGVSKSSIIQVEKGAAKDIDFYVKYAKALNYSLSELMDIDFRLVPINNLSSNVKLTTSQVTQNIRNLLEGSFFSEVKTVADIRKNLLENGLIEGTVTSNAISAALSNLRKEEIIDAKKVGGKYYYKKP
ncbi:helix-turn-helix domain-containing protein [Myroides odoratimimus]|uniref:helix-turn-helix domain-containing protein n=1 Tax=Myroides odoratimimus TaxID=76832 RepID=UPI00217F2A6A|nr:helix-turn-helix transcriptional regulator [Myroides odoratimimus]MCS7474851.1 helix-turn-helix domain-containing protein [Myroides odoratimimus]